MPETPDAGLGTVAPATPDAAATTTTTTSAPIPPAPTQQNEPDKLAAAFDRPLTLQSRAVHADDYLNSHRAVAPPMHVSTTFRYSDNPDELAVWSNVDVSRVPFSSMAYR